MTVPLSERRAALAVAAALPAHLLGEAPTLPPRALARDDTGQSSSPCSPCSPCTVAGEIKLLPRHTQEERDLDLMPREMSARERPPSARKLLGDAPNVEVEVVRM